MKNPRILLSTVQYVIILMKTIAAQHILARAARQNRWARVVALSRAFILPSVFCSLFLAMQKSETP